MNKPPHPNTLNKNYFLVLLPFIVFAGIVVSFNMYRDGCVPDMLDVPLAKWKIFENNPGIVIVDTLHEFALREQQTKAKSTLNLVEGEPFFDRDSLPEAPPQKLIPYEVFTAWLAEQAEKMYENERNQTMLGRENG